MKHRARLTPLVWSLVTLAACSSAPTANGPYDAAPAPVDTAAPLDTAATDDASLPPDDAPSPPDAPLPPDDVPLPPDDVPPPPDDVPTGTRGGPCTFSFECERDLAGPVCHRPLGEIDGRCVECIPGTLCDDGVTVCNRMASCNSRCASDDDCADSALGPRCNTTTGTCARCLTRADCAGSYYCDAATNRCEYGCGVDADCAGRSSFGTPTERCGTTFGIRACVQCTADSQCAAGQRCDGNRCVAGCTATSTCPTGTTCCGGGCVDTRASLTNCGACGNACPVPTGSTATCTAGACGVGACVAGRVDCDRNPTNGCEVTTATSVTHCGACGNACPARANATPTCAAGACGYACNAGFGDCDADPANGCEVDLRASGAHCGRCGGACSAGLTCVASTCSLVCASGLTGCGMTCVDTQSSAAHCGGCGRACLRGQTCSAGACTGTPLCDAPQIACGTACVNPLTSMTHCGGCDQLCITVPNATTACEEGRCAATCAAGFGNCDSDALNGCETDVRTSVRNCGACLRACTVAHGVASCTAGSCGVASCDAGYFLSGRACLPTNPCPVGNGGCDANATCTPTTPGERTCTCNSGFVGDGLTCGPESTCTPACPATQTCVNRLCVGNGPLRVTLVWDRAGDMDLHLVPVSSEIYYGRRAVNGGTLDRDDTTGTGPENIYWSAAPPAGTYLACVVPYRIAAATNFTVTVNRPGVPALTFTGSRAASSGNAVCSAASPWFVGMFTL